METRHKNMYEEKIRYMILNEINIAMSQLKVQTHTRDVPTGMFIVTTVSYCGRIVSTTDTYIPKGGNNV